MPNAVTEAPARNAIRREKLVIIIPLFLAATQGNTAHTTKGYRTHNSTVALAICQPASHSSPTEQAVLANAQLIAPPLQKGQTKLAGITNLLCYQLLGCGWRANIAVLCREDDKPANIKGIDVEAVLLYPLAGRALPIAAGLFMEDPKCFIASPSDRP